MIFPAASLLLALLGSPAALGVSASPHVFAVVVNGGVAVTSEHLTPGEVITRGGVAYRVVRVHPIGGHESFVSVPRVTAGGSYSA